MELYESIGIWYLKGELYVESMNQSYLGEELENIHQIYSNLNVYDYMMLYVTRLYEHMSERLLKSSQCRKYKTYLVLRDKIKSKCFPQYINYA